MRGYKDQLCSGKVLTHFVRFFQSFRFSCSGVIFFICINNFPYALLIIHVLFFHVFYQNTSFMLQEEIVNVVRKLYFRSINYIINYKINIIIASNSLLTNKINTWLVDEN